MFIRHRSAAVGGKAPSETKDHSPARAAHAVRQGRRSGESLQSQESHSKKDGTPANHCQNKAAEMQAKQSNSSPHLHVPPSRQEVGRNDHALCPRRSAACHGLRDGRLRELHVSCFHERPACEVPEVGGSGGREGSVGGAGWGGEQQSRDRGRASCVGTIRAQLTFKEQGKQGRRDWRAGCWFPAPRSGAQAW